MRPDLRRKGILLAGSLVASLTLGEVGVRLVLPAPGYVAFPGAETRGVMRPDLERGYGYSPNLSRRVRTADYEIDFATNDLGMRDDPIEAAAPAARRVLAVGDSYTQGNGVQLDESWPKQLQRRLGSAYVFNAGVSGYGLDQMRQTAGVLFQKLGPEAIVVGVYGQGYDRVTDPYVVVGDGAGLVRRSWVQRIAVVDDGFLVPTFETPWLRVGSVWIDRHWQLGGHALHLMFGGPGRGATMAPPAPDRAKLANEMRPMLEQLDALRGDAERWRVAVVALLVNPQEPDGSYAPVQRAYNEVVATFARQRGICLVDPLPSLERLAGARPIFRLGRDRHWSAAAHARAAEAILQALEEALALRGSENRSCRVAAEILLRR